MKTPLHPKPGMFFMLALLLCSTGILRADTVRINEIMSSNGSTIADEDGDFEDWIELYNYGIEPVDLSSWGLSDNPSNPMKWTFPQGTEIGPGEYLLVWASGKDRGQVIDSFTPNMLDPAIWLRADQVVTVTSGEQVQVERWVDLSGNELDAVQTTASNRPLHRTDFANPAIEFTGAHRLMFEPSALNFLQNKAGFQTFTVLQPQSLSGTRTIVNFSTGANNNARFLLDIVNQQIRLGGRRLDSNSLSSIQALYSLGETPELWETGADWLNGTMSLRLNGQLIANRGNGHSGGASDDTPSLGGTIGSNTAGNNRFVGLMSEIILFDRTLSAEEIYQVNRYLNHRYSLGMPPTLHTNFRLSSDGEPIVLSNQAGEIVDTIAPVALPRDISYGRTLNDPGSFAYYDVPTPGQPNDTQAFTGFSEPPAFSHSPGYHPAELHLEASHPHPEAVLRYTLDGSFPSETDPVLDSPLTLGVMPLTRGPLALIPTAPPEAANRNFGWNPPLLDTPKAHVVRVAAFIPGKIPVDASGTWFVGQNFHQQHGVNIFSIIVDPDDFFDPERGIYVPGKIYDENGYGSDFWGRPNANYHQRGGKWERNGHLEYFESTAGSLLTSGHVGVSIHGNGSRVIPQKSLRLYARNASEALRYPFFEERSHDEYQRVLLRNSGQDWFRENPSMIKDALLQRWVLPLGLEQQAYTPTVVYLNGEFWGMHNLRERIDPFYLSQLYEVDPDDVDLLYNNALVSDGGNEHYLEMMDFIRSNNLSDPAHYATVSTYMDVENFIDYLIVQTYLVNTDWPGNNIRFWRNNNPVSFDAGPGLDGRWRWILFDLDFAGFQGRVQYDMFTWLKTPTSGWPRPAWSLELINALWESSEFVEAFCTRYADLINSVFSPERAHAIADEMQDAIEGDMVGHLRRWGKDTSLGTWRVYVQRLRDFATNRPEHVWSHFDNHFSTGNRYNLEVNQGAEPLGTVRVNTLWLNENLTPWIAGRPETWAGTYFENIPVHLEAEPTPGHRFLGWRVGEEPEYVTTEPTFALSLTSDTTVEAVFEPIPQSGLPVALYLWDFEDTGAPFTPSLPLGGANLVFVPGVNVGSAAISNTGANFPSRHLRVNFPLESSLTFPMPTTGYEQISLGFLTRRSGEGAGELVVAYTTDGLDWSTRATVTVENNDPQPQFFDFSDIPEAADNPDFAIRFTFLQGEGLQAGNNRFDDIVLSGVALPGTNLPPVAQETEIPVLRKAVAGSPRSIDLSAWFLDPEDDPLLYTADSSDESVLTVSVAGDELTLTPLRAGDAVVTLTADDGTNPPVPATFRVLVYPAPHVLDGANYLFAAWSPNEPAGTFPENMIFLQSDRPDPDVEAPLLHPYSIAGFQGTGDDPDFPYAATSRTRVNGLGENGISFINTGRAEGRDLGAALLAMDTRGVTDITLTFTLQTLQVNNRVYAIRLQSRTDPNAAWTDVLDEQNNPVVYERSSTAGQEQAFQIALPSTYEGHVNLQLQWRYHFLSGSGARPEIRLDDIIVTSSGAPVMPVQLALEGLPSGVGAGALPPLTVRVLDAQGIPAPAFTGEITLTLSGSGSLSGTTTVQAVDGVAVFDDLVLTGSGLFTLTATASGLDSAAADTRALRLVDVSVPAFLQGEQDANNDNLNRIPVAFRFRIEGLAPNATYRMGNRMVLDADAPDNDGAGNALLIPADGSGWVRNTSAPRFRPADLNTRHVELTADPDGIWEGWVVTEPSGNARFTPGNLLRALLILNDGNGGEDPAWSLRSETLLTVLELGTAPEQATAVHGETTLEGAAFVALYDAAATLLALTHVEASGAVFADTFAAFYLDTVAAHPGRWGTLIPNSLDTGVAELLFLDASGAVLQTLSSGLAGTANASGGPLALWLPESADFVFLPGGDGTWNNPNHWAAPGWPNAPGVTAIIPAPTLGNRAITFPESLAATVGEIHFTNGPHRNRIEGPGSLIFDGHEAPARIRVTDSGAGFAEFNLDAPVWLSTPLILEIPVVETSPTEPEFGALRLRNAWQGPGDLIKTGPGVASLTGGDKNITGELRIEQGVLRITDPATPGQITAASVLEGGQLRLVSTGANRIYALGGPLTLSGSGRSPDDVPEGVQRGILGALRFDPFANDNEAVLTSDIVLTGTAPVSIHVDGTRNRLNLTGDLSGPASLTKAGGGMLQLSGTSVSALSASAVNGILRIDGSYPELAVQLGAEALLGGTGELKTVAGTGTLSLEAGEILTLQSLSGLSYAFSATAGQPAPLLRLLGQAPLGPGLNAASTISVAFDSPPPAPPRIGFFSPAGADLAALTQSALWIVEIEAEALTPVPARHTAAYTLDTVSGTVLTLSIGPQSYTDWAAANLDPGEDSGPAANPRGTAPNLLAYALGLPAGVLPAAGDIFLGITEGNQLFARFRQPNGLTGIAYLVEVTHDLTDWSEAEILYDSRTDTPTSTFFDQSTIIDETPTGTTRFLRVRILPVP